MKRILILFFILLAVNVFVDAKTNTKYASNLTPYYLTLQADNGSIKQKFNEDGTITCVIKLGDVIRVSSILLNGEDITNQLEKNKLKLPVLTENTTLEISFDEISAFVTTVYNTITIN